MNLRIILLSFSLLVIGITAQAQWEKVNSPQRYVPSFGTDYRLLAAVGNTMFAAPGNGVVRSTDYGLTWIESDSGIQRVSWIPAPTMSVLYSHDGNIYAVSGNTIFISRDTGVSWKIVSGNCPGTIEALAVSEGNMIAGSYSGFAGDTIYLSSDTGKSWSAVKSVLASVSGFAESNSVLFAGIDNFDSDVLISGDNGLTWNVADSGPQRVIAITASGGDVYVAGTNGIFFTNDNGSTWNPINAGLPSGHVYSLAASGDTIFANPGLNSIYCSTNNGITWGKCLNNGLIGASGGPFLIDDGNVFMCVNGEGVFVSSDNGVDWTVHNPLSQVTAPVNRFVSLNGNLYACTEGGLYITTDSGAHWIADTIGMGASTSVWAITEVNGTYFAGTNSGLFLSMNKGATWTHSIDTTLKSTGILDFATIGNLFFALFNAGTFVSGDGGLTWKNPTYTFQSVNSSNVQAIGTTIYASTPSGIYFSPDSGADWYQNQGMPQTEPTTCFARLGNLLFAGTTGDGVWISTDSGFLWNEINTGLTNLAITALAVKNDTLYAGANGGNLFYSIDTGKHWNPIDTIIPYAETVNTLSLQNRYVFVGTTDSGIWRYSTPKKDSIRSVVLEHTAHSHLQLYPNPAFDRIFMNTDARGLSITDALGRKIFCLGIGNEIDISMLSPGIYRVNSSDGNAMFVKR